MVRNCHTRLHQHLLGPVPTIPFLYKDEKKNLRFCKSVHIDTNKNDTKKFFKNGLQSGYLQKRSFSKTLKNNVNAQTECF